MKLKILGTTVILTLLALASTVAAANPSHVRQLRNTNACPGCDLSGADLKGWNLRNADLRGADLSGANLRGANLYGARR